MVFFEHCYRCSLATRHREGLTLGQMETAIPLRSQRFSRDFSFFAQEPDCDWRCSQEQLPLDFLSLPVYLSDVIHPAPV